MFKKFLKHLTTNKYKLVKNSNNKYRVYYRRWNSFKWVRAHIMDNSFDSDSQFSDIENAQKFAVEHAARLYELNRKKVVHLGRIDGHTVYTMRKSEDKYNAL